MARVAGLTAFMRNFPDLYDVAARHLRRAFKLAGYDLLVTAGTFLLQRRGMHKNRGCLRDSRLDGLGNFIEVLFLMTYTAGFHSNISRLDDVIMAGITGIVAGARKTSVLDLAMAVLAFHLIIFHVQDVAEPENVLILLLASGRDHHQDKRCSYCYSFHQYIFKTRPSWAIMLCAFVSESFSISNRPVIETFFLRFHFPSRK